MHLGFYVYIVGETNTPAITSDDLLITISASGSTKVVLDAVTKATQIGAKVIALSANKEGKLSSLSQHTLFIDARKDRKKTAIMIERFIPMGTAFELSSLLFLEQLIITMMQEMKIGEKEMKKR